MSDTIEESLAHSRALWNRTELDLTSDEQLAQLLDRGDMHDWRSLYGLARKDPVLRQRMARIVMTIPLPLPRFWLAALASLGERIDLGATLPEYSETGT